MTRLALCPQGCNPCCGIVWGLECLTLEQFIFTKEILVEHVSGVQMFEEGPYRFKCGFVDGSSCKLIFVSPTCVSSLSIDVPNEAGEATATLGFVITDPCTPELFGIVGFIFASLDSAFFCDNETVETNPPGGGISDESWPFYELTLQTTTGTPPDCPTDPTTGCAELDDCISEDEPDSTLWLFGFDDYTTPIDEAPPFDVGESDWYLTNLNGQYTGTYTGAGPGTSYNYELEFYTPGDYGDASTLGKWIREDKFDPSAFDPVQRELYVYKLRWRVTCADDVMTVAHVEFFIDEYIGYDGGPTWPFPNGTYSTTPGIVDPTVVLEGQPYICGSSPALSNFKYDDFLSAIEGDTYNYNAAIGIG